MGLFAPSLFQAVREHKYVYQLSEPLLKDIAEDGTPFIGRADLGSQAGLVVQLS